MKLMPLIAILAVSSLVALASARAQPDSKSAPSEDCLSAVASEVYVELSARLFAEVSLMPPIGKPMYVVAVSGDSAARSSQMIPCDGCEKLRGGDRISICKNKPWRSLFDGAGERDTTVARDLRARPAEGK